MLTEVYNSDLLHTSSAQTKYPHLMDALGKIMQNLLYVSWQVEDCSIPQYEKPNNQNHNTHPYVDSAQAFP